MPLLLAPTTLLQSSFLEALDEYQHDGLAHYAQLNRFSLGSVEGFAEYVRTLLLESLPTTARRSDTVAQTNLWWVEGRTYLGRLTIRHALNEWLRETAGHIGYDVRPSARRNGHAKSMLAASIPVAHALGIDEVLVTCDHDNVASRKVIEANGGRAVEPTVMKLRYVISTAPADLE